MALGIEYNSTIPQMIQGNSAALVQGIRQIGQQISGHLTELQTKRDLGALAQEMQQLNVQSPDFPVQLAQLTGRHPLASRDDRAKMMLAPLGIAHAQWQAGEAEARAFNRAMAMQGARDRSARDLYDYKREKELGDPQNVGGALVVPRDPVTGQPNVLLPAPARAGSDRPIVANPGDVVFDKTGKEIARGLPKTSSGGTSQKRLVIESQMRSLDADLNLDTKEHQRLLKEEEAIKKELEGVDDEKKKADLEYRRSVKALDAEKALKKVNETRAKKLKLAEDLGMLLEAVEPELGMVPPNAVAPPAAGANVRRVRMRDPDGKLMDLREDQVDAALQSGWKQG